MLKALGGSDKVKVAVVKQGGVEMVVAAMVKHAKNAAIAENACSVLATVTLRNPAHCNKVMEVNGHEAVVQAMKIHPQEPGVQVLFEFSHTYYMPRVQLFDSHNPVRFFLFGR